MDQILEKWDEILMTVKTEHDISDIAFNTFLRPLEFYGVTGNTAYILVPSEQLGLSYISKKYYLPLKVAITEITGTEYEIKFILPEQAKSIASSPNKQKKPFYSEAASKSNLNSNYTFDTFVVGSNNRFAHSASLAVAESPGEAYNPLYIYGGPGLGKTHLMHSIGHFILERNPDAKIICKKIEADEMNLSDEILNYIATNIKSNIRELEGALNKLLAYSNLEKTDITMEIAQKELQNIITPDKPKEITPQLIIEVVSEHFQISLDQMISKNRSKYIARPRQIAMYLCKNMTDTPLDSIGALLGGRDHSTIIHGVQKISDEYESDETTRSLIDTIKKKINPN